MIVVLSKCKPKKPEPVVDETNINKQKAIILS